MKKDWEIKSFEDCIENVKYTTKIPSKDYKQEGAFPIVSQEEELISGYWDNENDLFSLTKPVVIFGDHTRVLKYVDFDFVLGADGVKILQPKDFLDTKFFMYFLSNANIKHLGYARHYRLLKELNVFVPPLEEQKRIVKILDEKFAQLESLKTNAQTNLQNTKDLFQSQLSKALSSSSNNKVVDLFDIKTGKLNSNAAVPDGKYPFFTCSREVFAINTYAFDCEAILLAGNNASGDFNVKHYCGKFNAYQRTYVITVKNSNETEIKLLYYVLENYLKQLKNMSVGANTRFLKLGMIQNLEYPALPLPEQKRIVKELDTLSEKTKALQNIYEQMLLDCEELKQSFLCKAFAGEL